MGQTVQREKTIAEKTHRDHNQKEYTKYGQAKPHRA